MLVNRHPNNIMYAQPRLAGKGRIKPSRVCRKKNCTACKPDSVPAGPVRVAAGLCHLSGSDRRRWNLRCLPPLPAGLRPSDARAAHPPYRGGGLGFPNIPPANGEQGVHGISTRKVYPPHELLRPAVRSYRTFSPLPRTVGAVVFCDPFCIPAFAGTPPFRWCGALCCPDFPPRHFEATEQPCSVFYIFLKINMLF